MGVTPTDVEKEVRDIDIIVSKGNEAGDITYANPIFFSIAGYTQAELMDQPHSIIRHPDMPKIVFKLLWDHLKEGTDTNVFVKNLCKDGSFYWVFAHVRVATNPDGSFRNYVSTRKAMNPAARAIIEPLYKEMIDARVNDSMEASQKILEDFLASQGGSLETFNDVMIKIQG
ncbi:MAG: PAS domain-containing protein [Campylobacterota bacterium]|nr:PAS domain-containing protein [Campylobacterota bacterium]